MGRWKGEGRRKIEEVVGKWNGKREREKGWRSVNIKKINVKKIIGKLEKRNFFFFKAEKAHTKP